MNTTQNSTKQNGLRTLSMVMIGLLAIQFVLGMVTNLYVQFPDTTQADQLWAAVRSQVPSFSHIVLGILLLVAAVIFMIRAANKNNPGWVASGVAGLVGILAALYGGVTFTTTQADAYSLVMAIGFIVAVLAYSWGLAAKR